MEAAEAESEWVAMRVAVCAAADARAACQAALRSLEPPRLSPSKDLLEAPIWTTWARYFSRVTQAKVLKYAHEIVSRGLQARALHLAMICTISFSPLPLSTEKTARLPDMHALSCQAAEEWGPEQGIEQGSRTS